MPTLPLRPGSKQPVLPGWQHTASELQWGRAEQLGLDRGNLGVLCDPRTAAVIDADDKYLPGTSERVAAILEGLGLALPRVVTPSGGRHYYLRIRHTPSLNYGLLPPDVGAGEIRLRGSFVVAPPSLVDGVRYQFEYGSPEDLRQVAAVEWEDLAALHPRTALSAGKLDALPVRLVKRDAPDSALELLSSLRTARRGQSPAGRRSRSEDEAAVVTMLASAGWSYSEVEALFEAWQPGHYREACRHAEAHPEGVCPSRRSYLRRTWASVLGYIAGTPERAVLADWYQRALALPWPGREGALEQAVYLAVDAIGWQFSSFEVYASLRDIAEHAGASIQGVSNALRRLIKRGLLTASGRAAPPRSTKLYEIGAPEAPQQEGAGREAVNPCDLCPFIPHAPGFSAAASINGELWGRDALGRSAGMVYTRLDATPRTINELAALTGKHRDTVSGALHRLAAERLAEKRRDGWIAGPARLEDAAQQFDVDGKARLRHERYQRQREAFQQAVAEGRIRPRR